MPVELKSSKRTGRLLDRVFAERRSELLHENDLANSVKNIQYRYTIIILTRSPSPFFLMMARIETAEEN